MFLLIRCLFLFTPFFFFVADGLASPKANEPPHAPPHSPQAPQQASPLNHSLPHLDTHNLDLYFSTIPPTLYKTFQLIVEAKSSDNLAQAVLNTKQLTEKKGAIGETASFLLGDLYLRQAQGVDQKKIDEALQAWGVAVRKYPKSINVPKALLKKGDIYFSRNLYPEALGNYQRVSTVSDKKYAGFAHVGMARSFQAWRRWNEALTLIKRSSSLPLSPEDRKIMDLIHADALYQLGRFEEAYQAYKTLLPQKPPYPKDPRSLFGYAESAYRTGRVNQMRPEMKALLTAAYDADTQGPVAPLALGRLHTLLKMDGESAEAEKASDVVYALMPHVPVGKTGKIMVAVSNLAALTCPHPCKSGVATLNLEQLAKVSKSLLEDRPFTVTAQGAVFDGLEQLERYERFDAAEEVLTRMIPALPSPSISPYNLSTKKRFREIVLAHFKARDDPKTRIRLYRRFRWAFEDQMTEAVGLDIAKSFLKTKDFATALNLLHPIAQNEFSTASEEALHLEATLLAKIGDYKAAEKAFVRYNTRYPHQHAVLTELGAVYNHLKKFELSAIAYETWLNLHPQDGQRHPIYQKIVDTYQQKKDIPNQIRVYQAWIEEIPREADRPYMELADLYYQQEETKNAIKYYERALTFETEQQEIDWGLLHLADVYLKDGQTQQATIIYKEVEKRAKNPLLKRVAIEKRNKSDLR